MHSKDADEMANTEDPDQNAQKQSDLGLQYLPKLFCLHI